MFFSNFVMFFIILTTAATLHSHGITHISTAHDAAEALRPLAGKGAYLLFTLGLMGTGMLGVPVLAGSSAYAISEAMAWKASLEAKPRLAPKFYSVVALAMLVGLALDYLGVDAVKMLFWSAVANGSSGAPADCAGGAADQRPGRDGPTRESAMAALDGLGCRRGDVRSSRCHVRGRLK